MAFLVLAISSLNASIANAQTFQWPLSPFTTVPNITQDHACKGNTASNDGCVSDIKYHAGIDMTLLPSVETGIYASEAGTVVLTKNDCDSGVSLCNGGFGNAVIIQHGANLYSLYAHLKKDSIPIPV